MGWKGKLAGKAMDVASTGIATARHKIEAESATSRLKALRDMRDDQPITIEALLVLFVDAVHEDTPRELSKRDVKKAGKRRQRLAGGLGMFGGPVGMYIASLYSEAEILCDVADRHELTLSDEDLAAHLLVMWNAMPDFESARAAIDGSGQSVAYRTATQFRDRLTSKPLDQMTKADAVLALWRLRGVATDTSLPGTASPRDVLLPGSRVKSVIKAAERQLGVHGGQTATLGRRVRDFAGIGSGAETSDDLSTHA
jgi:hypothetical protein